MKRATILSSIAASLVSLPVIAEPTEKITVTGTHLKNNISQAQTTVSATEIAQINPSSVIQLLKAIPHLNVNENANGAGQSFVSIRGGESNFTLVMIDNIVVNDPTNSRGGGFDFNQLNVQAIDRIEVYRGSASSVYGSDSLSGVIHFITKKSSSVNALSAAIGQNGYRSTAATFTHQFNDVATGLLSLSDNEYDEDQHAKYDNQQLLGKLNLAFDNHEHQIFSSYSKKDSSSLAEDSGGELYASPASPEHRTNKQYLASFQSTYNLSHDSLNEIKTVFSWAKHKEDANHPGILPTLPYGIPASQVASEYEEKTIAAHLTGQFSENIEWVAGLSRENKQGKNAGFLDYGFQLPVDYSLEQTDYSAFAEALIKLDNVIFNISARFENPEQFDNDLSTGISMQYQIADTTLSARYNESFKLPSFFALAHPLIGNPDLKPEEASTYELGINQQVNTLLSIDLVWFKNDFTNLVDFDPEIFKSVNRSSVVTEGAEFSLNYATNDWLKMQFDIGYLDHDIKDSDSELRRRPKWQAGLNAILTFDQVTTSIILDTQSDVYDSSVPTGVMTLGGYTNVDINTTWQLTDNIALSVAVDNLLDKKYQESVGFYGVERQLRFAANWSF
ncbi:TonB-dependent receptor plug domain-containing protein [Thalassotalea atypica]|uniref:TonB-dependent receptor plug domain-containing protein n=1 Tax=Thalassotalea atypica TaxID=2054316 RepID=UPI002572AF4B|nr:TonB-dependent receptor [Thalassotalea atypica]